MWGKNKKQEKTITMNPNFEQDSEMENGDIIGNAFNQPEYQQQVQQMPNNTPNQMQNQGYQPSMMHQQYQPPIQQPNQMPVQPAQYQQMPVQNIRPQFQPMAKVIKAENLESGEYVYVVVTNYPLKLGDCQLIQ